MLFEQKSKESRLDVELVKRIHIKLSQTEEIEKTYKFKRVGKNKSDDLSQSDCNTYQFM